MFNKMKSKQGISAIIIVYNEESVIKECLESIKNAVDEIVVVHDGPCKDNTVKIAKKYTNKVYQTKHRGRSAFNFITALKKTKYNWILKLDADESLSPELKKNIKKIIKEENVDGFSFIHPLWNGEKTITSTWPRKQVLVRKSKISYLAFPGFDASININGIVKKTNYIIRHKPIQNQDIGWSGFAKKVLGRYAPSQAKFLLKDFKDFEKYQYNEEGFPLRIKIRRYCPIFTNMAFAFLSFFKQTLFEGAWREGYTGLKVTVKTAIYNIYLGFLIQKEKFNLH
jgi:glycosyltransferase involved in cell wall biosynthesis